MVRELLEDTRQASLDEPGRIRLRQIYERAIGELEDVLSPDLQEELSSLAPPMQGVPTDAEIRVAQAQLVGWLEGLFHGIQAALFSQQMAARAQFEELRRRGLPGSTDDRRGPARTSPGASTSSDPSDLRRLRPSRRSRSRPRRRPSAARCRRGSPSAG